MSQKPCTYNVDDFIVACGQNDRVFVSTGAQNDADEYFNLQTQQEIRYFIYTGGLENLEFIRTDVWLNNPDHNIQIMQDEYSFQTKSKFGYLAFFYNKKTNKWIIKSFKKNWNSQMQSPFILKKSGLTRLVIDPDREESK